MANSTNLLRLRNLAFVAMVFFFNGLFAQLTGVKTIPTDYASVAAFVTDVNAQGVGTGGVTLNVPAGYTETLTGKITLTATGTAANPITIQKSGSGVNPKLIAYVGTNMIPTITGDGFFVIDGGDYITIDGLDLQESSANVDVTTTMEFGYAMTKASVTNGAQYNTIKNCNITLSRINNAAGIAPWHNGSMGIAILNTLSSTAAVLTPTSAAGSNSNNTIISNTINGGNAGVVLIGFSAVAPTLDLGDWNNNIGGTTTATGNTILNFGGAALATNPATGVFANNQWNLNVSYNTINNNNGSGVNHVSTLRGIFLNSSSPEASATCNNNVVSIYGGGTTSQLSAIEVALGIGGTTNTIDVNNNNIQGAYLTATTGTFYGIYANGSTPATLNINNNNVHDIAYSASTLTGTGAIYGIYKSGLSLNSNVVGNIVTNITRTGTTGGSTYPIYLTSGYNWIANNNTVSNITINGTGTACTFYGMYVYGYASAVHQVNNNLVTNINQNKTTGSSLIYGIYSYLNCANAQYNNNNITNLTNLGTGTYYGLYTSAATATSNFSISGNTTSAITSAGTTVYPYYLLGGGGNIRNNTSKNITSTNTSTSAVVAGMYIGSASVGLEYNIFNNVIGDIKAPNGSNAVTAGSARVRGLMLASTGTTTNVNVFNNTVYLDGTSSAVPFTSAALHVATSTIATSGRLKLVGNIFVNNCTPTGTGKAVAYARTSTTFTNFDALNSGNNVYYAGTPGTNNVLYWDATNNITTVAAYQTLVVGEAGTFTENPSFLSTVSSNPAYLHINPATPTLIESGSLINATLNNDIDGDIRAGITGYTGTGSAPDIGADEFAGITPAPQIYFTSVAPAFTPALCTAAARTITASVTTSAGTITAVNINYSVNGVAQAPIAMTNTSGTTWTGTIPVPTPVNATIAWAISATNSGLLTSVYNGTSYNDEPLFGATAVATASATTICSGANASLLAVINTTPAVYTPAPVSSTVDEDLANVTISYNGTTLLNNTTAVQSLVGTIGTGTGTAGAYSDFSALATVAMAAGNTYQFSLTSTNTGFNYSNSMAIFIDFNKDGDFVDAGEMVYQPAGTQVGPHTVTGSFTIPSSAFGTTRMRVVCLETLITSYGTTSSWGEREDYTVTFTQSVSWFTTTAVTVGTNNPQSVSPTTTTTYGATVFGGGCSVQTNLVTVNTLDLPTAPSATNSTQCGTNTPLAAVASTAGANGSGQFFWYDAASNGTIVQNPPVSSTYTTFYSNDFTATTIGAGATLTGVASLTNVLGQLELTPNALSQQGGILVAAGVNAQKYKVDFDFATNAAGADGFSYSFGNDVNPASTSPAAELGSGSKLKVSFDGYGATNPNAAGIYLVYNNTAASYDATSAGVLGYVNNVSWVNSGSNHATIETNELGQVTVTLNGTALFTNVQLPAAYLSANKATWAHAFAARTGGVSMQHTIDNLVIQTAGFAAGSTTFQNPISATTTYYVTELGTNGCYSALTPLVATVVSPDPIVIPSGLAPAVCLGQAFTTTASSIASPAYTYTWDIPSYTGSGISAPVSGATLATTATAAGVYPFTITGTNGVCTAVVTVNLTVNALPVITTATATPAVVCHNADVTLTASSIVSGPQTEPVGYCPSNATSTFDEEILSVSLGSMTNASTCTTTGGAGSIINQYSNYTTSVTPLNMEVGSTYPLSIQIGTCNGNYSNRTKVFIDWNRDGDFADAGETAYSSAAAVAGPHVETGNITVPAGAVMGITRMRVVNVETTVATGVNPCGTYTWGETEDYWVNIQSSPAIPYGYVWNSTPAVNAITGTTVAINNTAAQTTQSWTVTATEAATGCTNTMTTAPVTIQPAFLVPTATNSTHCGTQVPTASVADPNGFTTPTFNWYATPALGTALQSSTANTFGAIVGTTTTLYATVTNPATSCQSLPTPVLVTVIAPPALTLSSNALTTCDGVASPTATLTGASSYDNFTWSPSVGVSGSSASGYNFTSSASGTYTLTAVQTTGQLCATTATLALTVNPNPIVTMSAASPVDICNGGTVTVTASSTVSGPQTQPTGYCTSNATSTADEEILGVAFAGINNTSTCTTTGGAGSLQSQYSNYTATVPAANLMLGSTYPLVVSIGTCGGNYSNFTKVFIDYNRDGDFADAGETVYQSAASTVGAHAESGFVLVPTTAQLGVTRMRVVNVETTVATGVNPCGTYTWGETEDYLVNLQSPPPAVYTYVWNTIPAVSSISGTTVAVNNTPNDVIEAREVTATNPATGCFTQMTSNNFTIHPTPVINAGVDVLICSNNATEQATLTASGAGPSGTYAWTGPVAGVVNGTPFTVGATGTYSVIGTTQWGCFSSDTLLLTYSTIPAASAGVDQAICFGQTATFAATGLAPYDWTMTNYANSGLAGTVTNSPSITVTPTQPGTYTYQVNVANGVGCTNNDQATLTVWALPVVNAGVDQTICNASPVILAGSGALSYVWTNGVSNATPFFPSSTATYNVVGTDINGCQNQDDVVVNVLPQPIVLGGLDQTICAGTPIILNATTTSATPTAVTGFQWSNNVTNNTQYVPTNSGVLTVTATGANGCTNQDQILVTVLALPTVNAGQDFTVCAGLSATLNASGAVSYAWNNGVTQGVPFYPNATQTYTVVGTGANGCTNNDQVIVTVSTGPTVNLSAPQTVCANAPATLSAAVQNSLGGFWTTTNGTGTISPNVTNGTVTYTPNVNDPVVVNLTYVATNACGSASQNTSVTVLPIPVVNAGPDFAVCQGTAATLTATGTGFLTWTTPNVTNGIAFVPTATATYNVVATGFNNCTNNDQVTVTVLALPDVNAGANQTICSGETVTLNGQGAVSYQWTGGVSNNVAFAPSATATYTVTGTGINGCENSDQVTVVVNATPVATISVVNDITLAASPAGMNYQWINCASGTDAPNGSTANYTAIANGSYAVIVTSPEGCSDQSDCEIISAVGLDQIANIEMSVNPNPTAGELTINMPNSLKASAQVFDAQGKLVQTDLNVENGSVLHLESMTTGVYMVRISTADAVQTFRVVKQ
jgi:hypothetical protein